eukprot:12123820-Alexandrium_andersonii.AAC.1
MEVVRIPSILSAVSRVGGPGCQREVVLGCQRLTGSSIMRVFWVMGWGVGLSLRGGLLRARVRKLRRY